MAKERKSTAQDIPAEKPAISALSLGELVALKAEIESLIGQKQREARETLYNQVHAMVQSAGFGSIEAFLADYRGGKVRGNTVFKPLPKYRNPGNHKQTWTGQGRRPGWVLAHLNGGGQMEELEYCPF